MYSNIDKSAFRKGQYVGYAIGKVWRIYKDASSGFWYATSQGKLVSGNTLRDVSEKLASMKVADTLANPFAA